LHRIDYIWYIIWLTMTTTALKKELIKAIGNSDDASFLQAVYTLVNEKSQEQRYALNPDQWKEIERRQKEYKAGKSKTYTLEETKKMMRAAHNDKLFVS
jgi:hypothetical protein